jgi:hypothetical protein
MADAAASTNLQSEAFRRLYPEEFYAKFIAEGVRPDGRPLGRPRPVSIGLGSIGTADASAHVKVRLYRRSRAAEGAGALRSRHAARRMMQAGAVI